MKFEKPDVEIIYLDPANVITTSGCPGNKSKEQAEGEEMPLEN